MSGAGWHTFRHAEPRQSDDQNRDRRSTRRVAQSLDEFDSSHQRHHQIRDDEIWSLADNRTQRLLTISHRFNVVFACELVCEMVSNCLLILDEQNARFAFAPA
jgi:hypothetical protein